MENIDQYLDSTDAHLGIERQRYGGGYIAIAAHRCWVDFLFEKLEGDDTSGAQAQSFFADNPLFPAGFGKTPSEALKDLDRKLGILYVFEKREGTDSFTACPKFELLAQHDIDSGEEQTYYSVNWDDVVSDLRGPGFYFYDEAKEVSNYQERRDLHALLNFDYQGEFKQL